MTARNDADKSVITPLTELPPPSPGRAIARALRALTPLQAVRAGLAAFALVFLVLYLVSLWVPF